MKMSWEKKLICIQTDLSVLFLAERITTIHLLTTLLLRKQQHPEALCACHKESLPEQIFDRKTDLFYETCLFLQYLVIVMTHCFQLKMLQDNANNYGDVQKQDGDSCPFPPLSVSMSWLGLINRAGRLCTANIIIILRIERLPPTSRWNMVLQLISRLQIRVPLVKMETLKSGLYSLTPNLNSFLLLVPGLAYPYR